MEDWIRKIGLKNWIEYYNNWPISSGPEPLRNERLSSAARKYNPGRHSIPFSDPYRLMAWIWKTLSLTDWGEFKCLEGKFKI
jgi:hypothetical protein